MNSDFKECYVDPSLFIYNNKGNREFSFVYIDDIVITGSNDVLVGELIKSMVSEFSLHKLGELNYFLGIQIKKFSHGLHLTQ